MLTDLSPDEAFKVARRHLEERAASGDLAGMYDKWLRLLFVHGEQYQAAIAAHDGPSAASAMVSAIVATSIMIPAEEQNLPAMKLFAVLADIIATAWLVAPTAQGPDKAATGGEDHGTDSPE